MPRWWSIVIPVVAYLVAGLIVPAAVLIWLLAHHQPPYVLNRAAMGTPRSALGGTPITVRPASGIFDVVADGGTTAVYKDGSTATIVTASRPSQVIEKYASSLDERGFSSFSVGGFTERDATLADGRHARTFGIDETVFAFVGPSARAVDRLVAQSAVRRNTKREVGNDVLDGHAAAAVLIGIGWLFLTTLLAAVTVVRGLLKTDTGARPLPWYQRPS